MIMEIEMANKILSIECGRSLVRVIEAVNSGKEVKVYNSFSFDTPEKMFDENSTESFVTTLKNELAIRKIKTKKVIFVINSGRMAIREITIPAVKDNRIKDLIDANASDYFPVDLAQYVLVHEVVARFTDGDTKKLRINLLAIPKDIIDFYTRLSEECGFILEGMSYTGSASKQLMIKSGKKGVRALVKIDGRSSLISIMNNERLELQRHLNYGIIDAITAIRESGEYGNLSFLGALELLRENEFITAYNTNDNLYTPDVAVSGINRLKEEVTDSLRVVTGSIARIIDYYNSRNQDMKVEAIDIIGIGSYIAGFPEFLTTELGIETKILDVIPGLVLAKNCGEASSRYAEFYSCIGTSFKETATGIEKRLAKKKQAGDAGAEKSGSIPVIPAVICLCCIIASAGMYGFFFLQKEEAKTKNLTLKNQVSELSYIEDVLKENTEARANYIWLEEVDKRTYTRTDNLKAFFEELERKLPKQVNLVSIDAEDLGITMSINVNSMEAAADCIKQLRTLESMRVKTVSAITEVENEDKGNLVSFVVDLEYILPENTEVEE